MGSYLNPGNFSFRGSLRSKIYVDKSELIARTNEALCTEQKYICVSRPRRFGKSMAGGFEAAFHVAAFADFRVWIVAPIYDLSDKEFDWALDFLGRYEVKPGISLLRMCRLSSPVKGSRAVETPWGSFIKTKSTDNPDSLLGDELDLMILGEAGRIPKTVWERELRARLGPREGMVFAASTAAGIPETSVSLNFKGNKN